MAVETKMHCVNKNRSHQCSDNFRIILVMWTVLNPAVCPVVLHTFLQCCTINVFCQEQAFRRYSQLETFGVERSGEVGDVHIWRDFEYLLLMLHMTESLVINLDQYKQRWQICP